MARSIGVLLLAAFAWLPDCKGEGAPGSFAKFLPPFPPPETGSRLEEMCAAAYDGKRFWLDGYLQLPSNTTLRDGKAGLAFYARIDGNGRGGGRSIRVEVTSPGDIDDLWASATGKRGISVKTAQIDPDALRIRVKTGKAGPRDKIRLTFDIEGVNLQQPRFAVCRYNFVRAEKV